MRHMTDWGETEGKDRHVGTDRGDESTGITTVQNNTKMLGDRPSVTDVEEIIPQPVQRSVTKYKYI